MNVLLLAAPGAVATDDLEAIAKAIALSANTLATAWSLRPVSVDALANPAPWQLRAVNRVIRIVGGAPASPGEFSSNGASSVFAGPNSLCAMLDVEIKEALVREAKVRWIARAGTHVEDAFEAVGPVLGSTYTLKIRLRGYMQPISVSNFLLPKWFGLPSTAPSGFDQVGACKSAHEILPSGYHTTREILQNKSDGGTVQRAPAKTVYGPSFQKSAAVQRRIDLLTSEK
jgi:hypothetical protein